MWGVVLRISTLLGLAGLLLARNLVLQRPQHAQQLLARLALGLQCRHRHERVLAPNGILPVSDENKRQCARGRLVVGGAALGSMQALWAASMNMRHVGWRALAARRDGGVRERDRDDADVDDEVDDDALEERRRLERPLPS